MPHIRAASSLDSLQGSRHFQADFMTRGDRDCIPARRCDALFDGEFPSRQLRARLMMTEPGGEWSNGASARPPYPVEQRFVFPRHLQNRKKSHSGRKDIATP